ncbi:thiol-disulfide isomerase/thioredoxin [Filimonas zeae]|uniref:Thioredoxin domain-containing protein n=1 Tax=Filimonas zeae TaxID=1737353 RepID=A0A917IV52_9BACT|nr:TlpA disulfide reductase family protein [Filimonas zeae]MDR6339223.1 thiol-disulfide isomerase/thioredoxin [Filimonas zeae]GGH64550.1 hypothetical protein GCM10011379_16720 [Filimonas zeae]
MCALYNRIVRQHCVLAIALVFITNLNAQPPQAAATVTDTPKVMQVPFVKPTEGVIGLVPMTPFQKLQFEVNRALVLDLPDSAIAAVVKDSTHARAEAYLMLAKYYFLNGQHMQVARDFTEKAFYASGKQQAAALTEVQRKNALKGWKLTNRMMGFILAKQEKFDSACYYFSQGTDSINGTVLSGLPDDLYYVAVASSGDYKAVHSFITARIVAGDTADYLRRSLAAIFRRDISKQGRSFRLYYDSLAALAAKNEVAWESPYVAALRRDMLDLPGPAFVLYDSSGRGLSAGDLKGKVVVMDFWASWCIPCLASFRPLQSVIDKYRNDSNVVFLLINTHEKKADIVSWIGQYQIKRGYHFSIWYDKDHKVSDAYNAFPLPAKIILDKNGVMRFRTIGFPGAEPFVKELITMIELSRKPE